MLKFSKGLVINKVWWNVLKGESTNIHKMLFLVGWYCKAFSRSCSHFGRKGTKQDAEGRSGLSFLSRCGFANTVGTAQLPLLEQVACWSACCGRDLGYLPETDANNTPVLYVLYHM